MFPPLFDLLSVQDPTYRKGMRGNTTDNIEGGESMTNDDATWIMLNAFMILTMQSGFALLESGCVMHKNIANIMVKNTVDITVGGLSYFMFGYALSLGKPSNGFVGYGDFLLLRDLKTGRGSFYATYAFQFSFATTATTIVSGAIAERMTLTSYILFAFFNPILYAFPCCWVWNNTGFLYKMGVMDFAGALVVHFTGGVTALTATVILGPRIGRFSSNSTYKYKQNSPVTALTGTFMLWWAWLSFNSGSTFGMRGSLWKQAALSAINTMQGSIGGGVSGLILSYKLSGGYVEIPHLINSILGGLVSVTGICGITSPINCLIIGSIGAVIAVLGGYLLEKLHIDDPVGVVPVHLFAALWGVVAVGLFSNPKILTTSDNVTHFGAFYGGGVKLLCIQLLSLLVVGLWCAATSALLFMLLHKTVGYRMSRENEMIGADWVEHRVKSENSIVKFKRALDSVEWKVSAEDLDIIMGKIFKQLTKPTRKIAAHVRNFEAAAMDDRGTKEHIKNTINVESKLSTASASMDVTRLSTPVPSTSQITEPKPIGLYRSYRRHNIVRPTQSIEEDDDLDI